MLKAIKRILKCLTLVVAVTVGYQTVDHYRPQPIEPMTPQRRASHRIEYEPLGGRPGRPTGYCTGTAIGPHAILTASHCNKRDSTDTIQLDQAFQQFHIEKTLTDGRDHDIYLVDGPAFTNFVPYKVRPTKLNEHVYLFGSGGAIYPPRRLDGERIPYDDPSDVDADGGIVEFSMPVIHGDSGSAVFNDDGTIGAVTTYLLDEPWMFGYLVDATTLDFTPAFKPEQIDEATKFTPTEYKAPEEDSTPEPPPSFFNPFCFR